MAKVPITVHGIEALTKTLVSAGVVGLRQFTDTARKPDGTASEFDYSATSRLKGEYAVDGGGNVGIVLRTVAADVAPVAGEAAAGVAWDNAGRADVELTVSVTIKARDAARGLG